VFFNKTISISLFQVYVHDLWFAHGRRAVLPPINRAQGRPGCSSATVRRRGPSVLAVVRRVHNGWPAPGTSVPMARAITPRLLSNATLRATPTPIPSAVPRTTSAVDLPNASPTIQPRPHGAHLRQTRRSPCRRSSLRGMARSGSAMARRSRHASSPPLPTACMPDNQMSRPMGHRSPLWHSCRRLETKVSEVVLTGALDPSISHDGTQLAYLKFDDFGIANAKQSLLETVLGLLEPPAAEAHGAP
jgi:hypothetical protein